MGLWKSSRSIFSIIMTTTHYFDYNATTPIAPEVRQAMEPFLWEHYGNPSSLYHLGRLPSRAIRDAHRHVAKLLNAKDFHEIIFTSGGTESNNTAIRSALAASPQKKEIVISSVEHSSVRKLAHQLISEGYTVHEIPVDGHGALNLEILRQKVSSQTALVSLMLANNETGIFFPIDEIGAWLKEREVPFHVDAVQAVGKYPIDVQKSQVDYLSISTHKIYGPKGSGALFVRKGISFKPLLFGGSHEFGKRAGTENVSGIVGLGAAAELVFKSLADETSRLSKLRDDFETQILQQVPNVKINGKGAERLPQTSNLCFDQIEAEALLIALDQKGICASVGSACMSGANEPSHVLKAMGLSDEEAKSSLRFSFGRFTTQEQVDYLLTELTQTLKRIRSLQSATA
jgi:cysteine desulfurase